MKNDTFYEGKQMQAHNKATEWFDDLYAKNKETQGNIPWAKMVVNPVLSKYLTESTTRKGKALVIGCGLGDDAQALALAGYDVLAIDVSQTALDLAEERFPSSNIVFEKQDIFDMPEKYQTHFDFVFEAFTIQSVPVEFREKMIQAISNVIAIEGKLLLVAHKKEREFQGPPWPLVVEEVALFKEAGLRELSHILIKNTTGVSSTQFSVLYVK